MIGTCMICKVHAEVRHIPLYVIGSEGLWLCHACEMRIVEFVRIMMRQYMEEKKQLVLQQRARTYFNP